MLPDNIKKVTKFSTQAHKNSILNRKTRWSIVSRDHKQRLAKFKQTALSELNLIRSPFGRYAQLSFREQNLYIFAEFLINITNTCDQ